MVGGGHCVRVPSYFPLSSVRLISAHLRESRFGKNSLRWLLTSSHFIVHPWGEERKRGRRALRWGRARRRENWGGQLQPPYVARSRPRVSNSWSEYPACLISPSAATRGRSKRRRWWRLFERSVSFVTLWNAFAHSITHADRVFFLLRRGEIPNRDPFQAASSIVSKKNVGTLFVSLCNYAIVR